MKIIQYGGLEEARQRRAEAYRLRMQRAKLWVASFSKKCTCSICNTYYSIDLYDVKVKRCFDAKDYKFYCPKCGKREIIWFHTFWEYCDNSIRPEGMDPDTVYQIYRYLKKQK
jgi:predicted RNA-binding Zn-ribbon protein involved in translation (DUF1610 family)